MPHGSTDDTFETSCPGDYNMHESNDNARNLKQFNPIYFPSTFYPLIYLLLYSCIFNPIYILVTMRHNHCFMSFRFTHKLPFLLLFIPSCIFSSPSVIISYFWRTPFSIPFSVGVVRNSLSFCCLIMFCISPSLLNDCFLLARILTWQLFSFN